MKIRNGFVSNSSSSSFLIAKSFLTYLQIEEIKAHKTVGAEMGLAYADTDCWDITENELEIMGVTSMGYFNMGKFLEKIGVDMSKVYFISD